MDKDQLDRNLKNALDEYFQGVSEILKSIPATSGKWHDKSEPLPLNQPVLVYLKDGSYSVATFQGRCTVIGSFVPIEDVILLWIEIPPLPGTLDNPA